FAALNADPDTMRFFPATLDRLASDALVDRIESQFEQQGYGLWALEVTDTGAFIGFAGLNPMPDDVPGAGGVEVGWRLARAACGHGSATEAGRVALSVAFDLAEYDEVWSLTATVNVPSRAVMERLALRHVATQPHPALEPDSPIAEHVFYRITRAEYAALIR